MDKSQSESKNNIKPLQISIPKGGGAISNLGDVFQPNIFSGTGNYSVPIPITKARGFEPVLMLNYNSGNGNGIFGMGFTLSTPFISLRTSKGIPRYDGKDIYINGTEELVLKEKRQENDYEIAIYLPRVESAFTLVEHYVSRSKKESYWKLTDNKNSVSFYGTTAMSQICNPESTDELFTWLIDRSEDAKGNKICYNYKHENRDNVPNKIWEVNRQYTNTYIKSIQYGNYYDTDNVEKYAYEVVFDYGEYDLTDLDKGNKDPYTPVREWQYRPDAFSSFLSGFEIRTCRLCYNILIFHHFEDELGAPQLVKSINLKYNCPANYQDVFISSPLNIEEVTLTGYQREGKLALDAYHIDQMPPLKLSFSRFISPQNPIFSELKINNGSIPGYLGRSAFQPLDLNNEGIPGLLYGTDDGVYYSESLGNGEFNQLEALPHFPIDRNFSDGEVYLTDLEGKGESDIVVRGDTKNGFYEKMPDGSWKNFISFEGYPTDAQNKKYETAGLSNNGKADLMLFGTADISIYYSLGKKGYGKSERKNLPAEFPLIKEGYAREYTGFANMLGDGLSHRVRIANGKVECWPDKGYGYFGRKITLGNAPYFGNEFDASRLFLADIDGSGTTDILYVYSDRIELFINNNGNYFSDGIVINLPEQYSDTDQINFSDILGNGTACLIFTKAGTQIKHYFYNFIGEYSIDGIKYASLKPYLLQVLDNNLGAVTQIQYCSSTKFYLEDKKAGMSWVTRLPFPVQLVERKIVYDNLSKCIYSTHYKYHDGYFDHTERVFRGFGFVETWDTEEYDDLSKIEEQVFGTANGTDKRDYVPPVYTKTWHHTGAYFAQACISAQYKSEYYKGDCLAYDLPDSVFDGALQEEGFETIRQAYAALSGRIIRTEVYADDKELLPQLYMNPYTVEENNFEVKLYQRKGTNEYAVFVVNNRENISYHYERNPQDPRVTQNFVLESDTYGNTLKSCMVYLARRSNDVGTVYEEQQILKGVVEEKKYFDDRGDNLYCKEYYEIRKSELSGLTLSDSLYFSFDEIKDKSSTALNHPIPYGAAFDSGLQARLFSWERSYFWNDGQTQVLPLGEISVRALLHHHEKAAFTDSFIQNLFDRRLTATCIADFGSYILEEESGYWWNRGLIQYYAVADGNGFCLPVKTENSFVEGTSPLFSKSTAEYDRYAFLPVIQKNYLDENIQQMVTCVIDYCSMQPKEITDINGNTTQFIFDSFGQVIVSSLFGKERGIMAGGMSLYSEGETPPEYQMSPSPSFNDVIGNPEKYLQGAGSYFYYNLKAWTDSRQPACSINLIRQDYWHDDTGKSVYCQIIVKYNDGLGRELESKQYVATDNTPNCWRVTGKKVYNNKGKVFAEYLPYFSTKPEYEEPDETGGVPPKIIHYDPLEREIRIDTSKGFFSKTNFTPWEELYYDEDDTVIDAEYYKENYPAKMSADEIDAIDKAVKFYNTPRTKIVDNTGVVFLDIQNNLGNVNGSTFGGITKDQPVTSEDIVNELILKGYLVPDPMHSGFNWVTAKFRPYTTGFTLDIDAKFAPFSAQIVDILKQNELPYYYETDISSRVLKAIDPRLYYSNVNKGTSYTNFIYQYAMEDKDPLYIDGTDSGKDRYLKNTFDKQFWSFSARGYCQLIAYDRLQRKSQLMVKKITDEGPINSYDDFNLVEIYIYGESVANGKDHNLIGQLYELKDLSGIIQNTEYSMLNEVLKTSRQQVKDYRNATDWNNPTELDAQIYVSEFYFNAIKQLEKELTPENSEITNTYNQAGQLNSVCVKFPDKSMQNIVDHIDYNAEGKRNNIKYGNNTRTLYTYEDTTHRLVAIKTTRPATAGDNGIIQDIVYCYDPAGNITRTRDNSIATVFSQNQQVEPLLDYTCDALYRLIKASGRQHQGINGNTFKNNASDGSFKQCIYGPPLSINDAGKLENYTENYTYDDSTNLIKKQHVALSASWAKETYTEDNSNRIKGIEYDDSGNLRQLDINNSVSLSYNCCENMVKAAVIERPDEPDDSDYYLYDSNDNRTRKVSERMINGGSSIQVEDKIYLGNYEVKKNYGVSQDGSVNLKSERNTLRIMDDKTCVAIIYYFSTDNQNPENESVYQSRFQLGNYLGSVSLEIDKNAQIISYEEYFPYGGSAIITGSSQSEVDLKEYRYAGKECDDSTGLYYYGARYYAPWLGRWLKPDPEGGKDGLNVYSFIGGNPITAMDDDGRWKYIPFVGGAISTGVTSYQLASSKGYTGWKLAGLTLAGGVFGGAVGAVGDLISASCFPMAQTLSMAFTSTVTSGVLSYFGGGNVDVTTNMGVVNYDWSKQTLNYPFKSGNTTGQNAMMLTNFAMTNLSDIVALKGGGTNVELVTEHSDVIGHSAIVGNGIEISVGPTKGFYNMSSTKSLIKSLPVKIAGQAWDTHYPSPGSGEVSWVIPIHNVQADVLKEISNYISKNSGTKSLMYSGLTGSCVAYTGDALLKAGVPTFGALSLHPFMLSGIIGGRQVLLNFTPYLTTKVNPPHQHDE